MARRSTRSPAQSATLRAALAEAAWADADIALAKAFAELSTLERTRGAAQRAAVLALLGQALRRAARKRGFNEFGVVGEITAYDPSRHELKAGERKAPAKIPASVRISAPGVARAGRVLVKALAAPARSPVRA